MEEEKKSRLKSIWSWVRGLGWLIIPAAIVIQQTTKTRYDIERLHLLMNVAGRLGIGIDDTREGFEQE